MNSRESDLLGAESLERVALRYRGRMRAAHLATAKYLRNRAASAGEAGTPTAPQSGVVHEHAVGDSRDAQTPSTEPQ
jgi:hypothetical protein